MTRISHSLISQLLGINQADDQAQAKLFLVFLVQTKNTMLWESSSYSRTLLCSNFFQIICTLSFPSKNWTCSIFFHSSQNSYDRCYGSFRLQPSLIGFLLRGIRMHTQNRVQNKRMLKCFHFKIIGNNNLDLFKYYIIFSPICFISHVL